MEGPPLGPGGEDITWPDQVAPRGRKASSTRKIKPQTSNLLRDGRLDELQGLSWLIKWAGRRMKEGRRVTDPQLLTKVYWQHENPAS